MPSACFAVLISFPSRTLPAWPAPAASIARIPVEHRASACFLKRRCRLSTTWTWAPRVPAVPARFSAPLGGVLLCEGSRSQPSDSSRAVRPKPSRAPSRVAQDAEDDGVSDDYVAIGTIATLETVQLTTGRSVPGKSTFIIRLAGIDCREAAEELRGSKLYASASERPVLEEGVEYHVRDLIGMDVCLENQESGSEDLGNAKNIGRVLSVINAGNDILEIQLDGGSTALVPFVKQIVPIVDMVHRKIVLRPPPGLL
eukprot:tig00021123_g18515.t2